MIMKRRYHYRILYMSTMNNTQGVGSCHVSRKRKIKKLTDIIQLEKDIKEQTPNVDNVMVLSYNEMRG